MTENKAAAAPTNQLARPEDVVADTQPEFDSEMPQLFSSKQPRDAAAGFASGLKNIGKGIFGGAATLIAAPVMGAIEGGGTGFAKGLVAGVVGAVALPAAGIFTGVSQVARGIANTPAAFREKGNDKVWDQEKREWVFYDLNQEAKELINKTDEQFLEEAREQKLLGPKLPTKRVEVKDKGFYEILGVETDATRTQIVKAYRKKARICHPDRNHDDPEKATKVFQELGQAYQVLNDPAQRRLYDAQGAEGLDKPPMDASMLYTMVFGSEGFENYIGDLGFTNIIQDGMNHATQGGEDGVPPNMEEMFMKNSSPEDKLLAKFHRAQRLVKTTVHLRDRIESLVEAYQGSKVRLPPLGAEVRLHGLKATEYNGVFGVVVDYAERSPVADEQRAVVELQKLPGKTTSTAATKMDETAAVPEVEEGKEQTEEEVKLSEKAKRTKRFRVGNLLRAHQPRKKWDKCDVDPIALAKFLRGAKEEAQELSTTALGGTLLQAISDSWLDALSRHESNFFKSFGASLMRMGKKTQRGFRMGAGAVKVMHAFQKGGEDESASGFESMIRDHSKTFLSLAWDAALADIEDCITKAVAKLLTDRSVPPETREKRGLALYHLATAFAEFGHSREKGLSLVEKDIIGQLDEAKRVEGVQALNDFETALRELPDESLREMLKAQGLMADETWTRDQLVQAFVTNLNEGMANKSNPT